MIRHRSITLGLNIPLTFTSLDHPRYHIKFVSRQNGLSDGVEACEEGVVQIADNSKVFHEYEQDVFTDELFGATSACKVWATTRDFTGLGVDTHFVAL